MSKDQVKFDAILDTLEDLQTELGALASQSESEYVAANALGLKAELGDVVAPFRED